MKTIIVDTDFIINALKSKIELEYSLKELFPYKVEITLLDKTLEELQNKPYGKLAKRLLSGFRIIKTSKEKTGDELLLELVQKNKNIIVATQDKKLKEKLKKGKIPIITIRQKKYLIVDWA